ncbi:MAG: DUF4367 domain-containing protein [Clostridia bacterium]|nr:DUF4367 domain-containing protein [Clostridia bacterium]
MSHAKDFAGYPFTEEDLRKACKAYAEGVVRSAQDAPDLDFEPSEAHRTAIRRMIEQGGRPRRRRTSLRRFAVIAAVVVLVFAMFLAVYASAQSKLRSWLKQVLPDRVQYFFFGEPAPNAREYEIGWLPEGMQAVEQTNEEGSPRIRYANGDGSREATFRYYPMNSWDELQITGGEIVAEDVAFGGFEGTVYFDRTDNTALAVLFDVAGQMVIELSARNIDDEDVLSIVRSIE